ncbi:MAG: stage III sporulation protein AC [Clostridia bacterium]|jgi:stage III sporulation protein AC|nr:stage III sporulation protein AC [Clostridia bacterium]MBQ4364674.1 stage III sporulation protein AC [Clostridia bacterium]MBR3094238.1 stage III sporulation protein AC [Clostridia bacterium]
MEIELILKIAAVGVLVSVLNQILQRADKGEYTTLTTLMGVILVLLLILPQITALFDAVKELVSF